ncbi:hypothetical protein E2C01_012027 [Portunus trituberculatus]|uniref:Uncharacterized protein n=1 Tax=Portunus trituberculatus TaxID=210409 RepID=A0A5B7DD15_PORTR|nr:hypothetical protein [Portunus trituberculatus]
MNIETRIVPQLRGLWYGDTGSDTTRHHTDRSPRRPTNTSSHSTRQKTPVKGILLTWISSMSS